MTKEQLRPDDESIKQKIEKLDNITRLTWECFLLR